MIFLRFVFIFNNTILQTNNGFIPNKVFLSSVLSLFYLFIFYLPYLTSIYEKAMYRYVLEGKSALAWELPFPGHLSST